MRKGVTCGDLNAAIAAVSGAMADCSTRKTLEALYDLTDDAADGDFVKLKGPAPVTMEALDAALADVQEPELGLSAGTLTALRRVRVLLAREQAARDAEPPQYVTVAQLKAHDAALFDAFAWALGAMAAQLNRGQPNREHALGMMRRSAETPERKKLLAGICEFRETDAPPKTQAEFLRYQAYGNR